MNRSSFIKIISLMGIATSVKGLSALKNHLPNTSKMPVLFLGHGSPMNAIEENEFVTNFRKIAKRIPKPQAILCVSAHWETKGTLVTAMANPKTIHDFGGFPKALFDVQYPARGSRIIAEEMQNIIKNTQVGLDYDWGLDHGCWSVVKHLYPNADIPVLQLSLDYLKDPAAHYALGKELQELRNKGILIIGSGNIVHNLGALAWDKMNEPNYAFDWNIEARTNINKFILDQNHQELINIRKKGRAYELAIPSMEHYLPLLYILGLQNKSESIELFNDVAVAGSLSMTSVAIGLV
jgi:4,5-DOPA dioxygenase extradiol